MSGPRTGTSAELVDLLRRTANELERGTGQCRLHGVALILIGERNLFADEGGVSAVWCDAAMDPEEMARSVSEAGRDLVDLWDAKQGAVN